jgi:hypothetical protein
MSIKQNIVIEQGTTFSYSTALTDSSGNPFNTANCTVAGTIRKTYSSSNSIAITANAANSVLTLLITANTTSTIWPGRYVYDVIITRADGTVNRLLEGIATVMPDVTRPT